MGLFIGTAQAQRGTVSTGQFAVTNVTGDLVHGSTLTITGAQFGVKPHGEKALAWVTYEPGEGGTGAGGLQDLEPVAALSRGNGYLLSGTLSHTLDSTILPANASQVMKATMTTATEQGNGPHYEGFSTDQVYLSVKKYFAYTSNYDCSTSTTEFNTKAIRFSYHLDGGYPNCYNGKGGYNPDPPYGGYRFNIEGVSYGYWPANEDGNQIDFIPALHGYAEGYWTDSSWEHHQCLYGASGLGVADGTFNWWRNDVELIPKSFHPAHRNSTYPGKYTRVVLDQHPNHEPANTHVTYYKDFYIDDSWCRVIIGNASTWDACTVREPQPPITWADGQITVSCNQGEHSTLEGKYLYVADASDNITAGYPL